MGSVGATKLKTMRAPDENLCRKLVKLEPCVNLVTLLQVCPLDILANIKTFNTIMKQDFWVSSLRDAQCASVSAWLRWNKNLEAKEWPCKVLQSLPRHTLTQIGEIFTVSQSSQFFSQSPDTPSLKLETFSQFHRFHSFWVKIGDIEFTKYIPPVFEISQFLVKASDTTSLKLEQNEIHSIHTYIHIIMQQLVWILFLLFGYWSEL